MRRETAKALLLVREDGHEQWFPKSAVEGPDDEGGLQVADWLLAKEPLPSLADHAVTLPAGRRRPRWQAGAFSFSRANVFLGCPRSYHFGYERRLPGRASQALGMGNSVHSALEGIFDCDLEAAPPTAYLERLLRRAWDSERARFARERRRMGRWDDARRSEALDQARWGLERLTGGRVSAGAVRAAAPVLREEAVYDAEGRVGGYVDALLERDGKVVAVDYKTGRAPEALPDDHRLQGLLYAWLLGQARGEMPDSVELWYLGGGKVESVEPTTTAAEEAAAVVLEARAGAARLSGKPEEEWEARPGDACRFCDYKPWCAPFRAATANDPWQEEGWGRVVSGTVKWVRSPGGKAPTSMRLATAQGDEVTLKGWEEAGARLRKAREGDEVACVDARVEHSDWAGELEATVSDPYAVLIAGEPPAVPDK